ncbi:hypothetical protein IQ07DRAFT_47071 [Pyrenochaeta sp. DS3sAY3a]|nr:hypothetical protein IQ07DRAFT_47071 [Pyrenochaeta sp. DS3sAY3a]
MTRSSSQSGYWYRKSGIAYLLDVIKGYHSLSVQSEGGSGRGNGARPATVNSSGPCTLKFLSIEVDLSLGKRSPVVKAFGLMVIGSKPVVGRALLSIFFLAAHGPPFYALGIANMGKTLPFIGSFFTSCRHVRRQR